MIASPPPGSFSPSSIIDTTEKEIFDDIIFEKGPLCIVCYHYTLLKVIWWAIHPAWSRESFFTKMIYSSRYTFLVFINLSHAHGSQGMTHMFANIEHCGNCPTHFPCQSNILLFSFSFGLSLGSIKSAPKGDPSCLCWCISL